MTRFIQFLAVVLLLVLSACGKPVKAPQKAAYNLIPIPAHFQKQEGFFHINQDTKIVVISSDTEMKDNADYLNEILKKMLGFDLAINVANQLHASMAKNTILLVKNDEELKNPEAYQLDVLPQHIWIESSNARGAFYAIQTLLQLMQKDASLIAAAQITDEPRYAYRGMHLDVARHFFSPDFVKKYIDYLARYKYNSFHWHLTEDQGWRIEIKKYPKLQEIAAYRKETLIGHYSDKPHRFDGERYGGYYTQDEIKDIVAYAKKRHITIIPEIEMPGHAQAAIAAYPELGCREEAVEVATKWGVFEDVYCPTETTFEFLENVLMEVMALFPSKYIHIGGDECPKTAWKESAFCQELIQKEGLKDEHELQSYFIQRIEKFLNAKGRSIIGWDEILEGGLAPNATVMSWRGMKGGIEAAEQGHNVIMTPGTHCYFDHYQSDAPDEPLAIGGYNPVEHVYSFEPTPPELNPEQAKHILGAQGNVWTEYMKTPEKVEYMIFPRMCALAEVVWSPKSSRNYSDFVERLEAHLQQLKKEGVNVANHLYNVKAVVESGDGSGVRVQLSTNAQTPKIRYSMDDSKIDVNSPLVDGTIQINKSGKLRAYPFVDDTIVGKGVDLDFNIHKAAGKKIELEFAPSKKYSSGGIGAIVNGLLASDKRYGDREWLGFDGKDCVVMLDLGAKTDINTLKFRFYNGPGQWIYPPKSVALFVSNDGVEYKKVGELSAIKGENKIINATLALEKITGRYLKIHIHRHGIIAQGEQGAGHEAWLFVDEIIVE